jgi:phospholipid/cholesterol/gamma-HCH transport system substrate-binding protein
MMRARWKRGAAGMLVLCLAVSGCGWQGLNSVPLPGVQGVGPGSFTIQAQMPDVDNVEQNSRVRVGDVNVGTVSKIERQGWHALVTMTLSRDVELPANATAKVGQTSLLGSQHIELTPPVDVAPEGKLGEGSVIPLTSAGAYPTTEQALAAIAVVLNGGGIGNIQDITDALSTAFAGRENDLRSLIEQLDKAIGYLDDQKGDIIAASESLNNLFGQIAEQKPVVDKALKTIPDALAVLKDQRNNLTEALAQLGKFSALAADSVNQTKDALVQELKDLGPVLQSLADAGPALTRALSFLPSFRLSLV